MRQVKETDTSIPIVRRYVADTLAMVVFSTVLGAFLEIMVAGLSIRQSMGVRLSAIPVILFAGRHVKARIRAKVEHPFRVIKRQFGHVKVRYRGLAKNTAQLHTLFALSNLWMARRQLMAALG